MLAALDTLVWLLVEMRGTFVVGGETGPVSRVIKKQTIRENLMVSQDGTRKVDVRLPGKGDSNSHGARPVHLIITMIKWTRTTRLSIKKPFSRRMVRTRGRRGRGRGRGKMTWASQRRAPTPKTGWCSRTPRRPRRRRSEALGS